MVYCRLQQKENIGITYYNTQTEYTTYLLKAMAKENWYFACDLGKEQINSL